MPYIPTAERITSRVRTEERPHEILQVQIPSKIERKVRKTFAILDVLNLKANLSKLELTHKLHAVWAELMSNPIYEHVYITVIRAQILTKEQIRSDVYGGQRQSLEIST